MANAGSETPADFATAFEHDGCTAVPQSLETTELTPER